MKQSQLKQRMLAVPLNGSKSVLQADKCLGVKLKREIDRWNVDPIVEHRQFML